MLNIGIIASTVLSLLAASTGMAVQSPVNDHGGVICDTPSEYVNPRPYDPLMRICWQDQTQEYNTIWFNFIWTSSYSGHRNSFTTWISAWSNADQTSRSWLWQDDRFDCDLIFKIPGIGDFVGTSVYIVLMPIESASSYVKNACMYWTYHDDSLPLPAPADPVWHQATWTIDTDNRTKTTFYFRRNTRTFDFHQFNELIFAEDGAFGQQFSVPLIV